MRNDDFDLDVTADRADDDHVVDTLDAESLARVIAALPGDLRAPLTAVLLEGRTYSDVSQDLGVRQAELVRAVHRGRALIARRVRAE